MLALMAQGHRPRRRGDLPVLSPSAPPPKSRRWSARRRSSSTSRPTPSTSIRRARSARSRPPSALGLKPKAIIPVDLFGLPADHDAIAAVAKPNNLFVLDDAAQAFGATYNNRRLGTFGARHRDQFFSGQAARLLRRRRRDLHRRRRHSPTRCCSLRVHGAGQRQIRQRPHRPRLPPRHHPGRDPDREAEDFSRRDRGAQPHRPALCRRRSPTSRSCRGCRPALTSVWAQYTIRLPAGARDELRGRAQGARAFRPRSTIQSRCTGRRPTSTFRSPTAAAGERAAGRRSDQPADARLSRRADAGPHHRRRAPRSQCSRRLEANFSAALI